MFWVLCTVLGYSDEHERSSEETRKINEECQHNQVRVSLVEIGMGPCLGMRGELHTDSLLTPV